MFLSWAFFILIIVLIQWYTFQCFKTISKNRYWLASYACFSLLIITNFIYQLYNYDRSEGFTPIISYSLGFFISLFVFQSIIVIGLFLEDISRISLAVYSAFKPKKEKNIFFSSKEKVFISIIIGFGFYSL